MAKGNAALTYLPAVEIVVAAGTCSVEALKSRVIQSSSNAR